MPMYELFYLMHFFLIISPIFTKKHIPHFSLMKDNPYLNLRKSQSIFKKLLIFQNQDQLPSFKFLKYSKAYIKLPTF